MNHPHRTPREHIDEHIDTIASLHHNDHRRTTLTNHLIAYITEHAYELEARRDMTSIILGAAISIGFTIGTYITATTGGWWYIGTAVCTLGTLAALATVADGLEKKPRPTP